MIKWVTVYKHDCIVKRAGHGETMYRVLYESGRLFEYYGKAPSTVRKFIRMATVVLPHHDYEVLHENGLTYWER